MNSRIIRTVTVTANYVALAAGRTAFTGEIGCPPANAGVVNMLGDGGADVPWIAGEWHSFRNVDLATFQIKGTAGDKVTINGTGGG
jgi:hypothetical protein